MLGLTRRLGVFLISREEQKALEVGPDVGKRFPLGFFKPLEHEGLRHELDLHRGRLRGWRVPRLPPELRRRLEGAAAARRPQIELVTVLPDRYLR